MNYENVIQIVQNFAVECFNASQGNYLNFDLEVLRYVAESFWENRTEAEIERDEQHNLDSNDYSRWIEAEYCDWLDRNKDNLNLNSISDLEEFVDTDISGKYDFNRDLYDATSNQVLVSIPLTHEDDAIGFVFSVVELNKWDSKLELIEIQYQ